MTVLKHNHLSQNKDICFAKQGSAGVITLSRDHSLNALSVEMMTQVRFYLRAWAQDPNVHFLIIHSSSKRAFCAGGDLKSVHQALQDLDYPFLETLFLEEYSLNFELQTYSKPIISLVDGIVMGGGVGLSVHGSHRVITENTLFAMPETNIGYFPDVGATRFLNRMPGNLGLYVGLSGNHFRSCDSFYLGYGTHYVRSQDLESLYEELVGLKAPNLEHINDCINSYHRPPHSAPLQEQEHKLNNLLDQPSFLDLVAALQKSNDAFLNEFLEALHQRSPTSLFVTFEQLRRGRNMTSFAEVMQMEFDLSQNFVKGHDFKEGIRAAVIHKDRSPTFNPGSIGSMNPEDILHWFDPSEKSLTLNPL